MPNFHLHTGDLPHHLAVSSISSLAYDLSSQEQALPSGFSLAGGAGVSSFPTYPVLTPGYCPSPRISHKLCVPCLPCAVFLEVFITSHLDAHNHFLSCCPKHSLHSHTTVSLISFKCSFVNLDRFPLSMPKLCVNMGCEWITGVLVYPFPKPWGQGAGLETA